jgi:hypothetical protein
MENERGKAKGGRRALWKSWLLRSAGG